VGGVSPGLLFEPRGYSRRRERRDLCKFPGCLGNKSRGQFRWESCYGFCCGFCRSLPILESVLRHFGFCGIGSCHPPPILESVLRHFGFCGIGSCHPPPILESVLRHVGFCGIGSCHPPPILESVLRHFGVCGIGSFVIHRLFWNRSCGVKRSLLKKHGEMATMCVYCHIFERQDAQPATKSLPTSHKRSRLGPHCDTCHRKVMKWSMSIVQLARLQDLGVVPPLSQQQRQPKHQHQLQHEQPQHPQQQHVQHQPQQRPPPPPPPPQQQQQQQQHPQQQQQPPPSQQRQQLQRGKLPIGGGRMASPCEPYRANPYGIFSSNLSGFGGGMGGGGYVLFF